MRHTSGLSSDNDKRTLREKRNAVSQRSGDDDVLLFGLSLMPRALMTGMTIALQNTRPPGARDHRRTILGTAIMMMTMVSAILRGATGNGGVQAGTRAGLAAGFTRLPRARDHRRVHLGTADVMMTIMSAIFRGAVGDRDAESRTLAGVSLRERTHAGRTVMMMRRVMSATSSARRLGSGASTGRLRARAPPLRPRAGSSAQQVVASRGDQHTAVIIILNAHSGFSRELRLAFTASPGAGHAET